jgi:hypothetical protein
MLNFHVYILNKVGPKENTSGVLFQGLLNVSKILVMGQSKLLLQKTETFVYTPQLINLIEASNIHPNMYLMDCK